MDKCQTCKEVPAEEEDACPYHKDIYDIEVLCNCCDECRWECMQDI